MVNCLFFPAKKKKKQKNKQKKNPPSLYPSFSLTSMEQFLKAVWEIATRVKIVSNIPE